MGKVTALPARPPQADGDLPLQVVARAAAPPPPPRSRLRSFLRVARFVPLVMLLVAAGGFVGLYFQPPGLRLLMAVLKLEPGGGTSTPIAVRPPALPPPGKTEAARGVAGLGRLLPQGDVVTLAPPYGAADARIATLNVREGDRVAAGAILAVLDNERGLKAAVDLAEATVALRRAGIGQVRDATIASRDEARASLAKAEAAALVAKRDLDRASELQAKGFAAGATMDAKRSTFDQAAQDIERAKATLARFQSGKIEAQSDMLVAARNLDSAQADLARANADLDKAQVRAPLDSTVLTIHVRPGEKPGALGIMTLGNIDEMTAEIEIYQTLIGKVSVGDAVILTADALPRPLAATVTRIGLEVARQTLTDASPAANTDARAVKVYAKLDAESALAARGFTNLQVSARIETGP